jgi:hypothetical protein
MGTALMTLLKFAGGDRARVSEMLQRQLQLRKEGHLCEACGDAPTVQTRLTPRREDVNQTELTQLFASAALDLAPRVVGYRCTHHAAGVVSPFSMEAVRD